MKKFIKQLFIPILSIFIALSLCSCKLVNSVLSEYIGITLPEVTTKEPTKPTTTKHEHTIQKVEKQDETCTADGYEQYFKCSTCDKMFRDQFGGLEIESLDEIKIEAHHIEEAIRPVNPTCTLPGNLEGLKCSRCNLVLEEATIVQPLGHIWNNGEISQNSTCLTAGEMLYECTVCHETKTEPIPVTDTHNFVWKLDIAATTSVTGIKHEECSICGLKQNENTVIDILTCEHNLSKIDAIEPTCSSKGNIAYYQCIVCNKYYSEETGSLEIELNSWVLPMKGHNWVEVAIIKEATCLADGQRKYECSSCHKFNFETIYKTNDHNLVFNEKVDATCIANGKIAHYKCTVCSNYFYDEDCRIQLKFSDLTIQKIDHNFDDGVKVDNHNVKYTCITCGFEKLVEIVLKGEIVENEIYNEFSIHVMALGDTAAGDSIYIKAGDLDILIDSGSTKGSAQTTESYINKYCKDGTIEYLIVTHGDADHINGLIGNYSSTAKYTSWMGEKVNGNGILYYYNVLNIIDNKYSTKDTDIYNLYKSRRDELAQGNTNHYYASDCYDNANGAQRTYQLTPYVEMSILYNPFYWNDGSKASVDENNYSVCVLFTYRDDNERFDFLLTGDLELEGEEALAAYYDGSTPEKTLPHCYFFKAGHHGSKTSSNNCLLELITPEICVASCCAGTSEYTEAYQNQFPTQEFINRISKFTDRVYVTSTIKYTGTLTDSMTNYEASKWEYTEMNGTVIISCNGYTIGLASTKNLIKLKDSEWLNSKTYVVGSKGWNISSTKKFDFYYKGMAGAIETPMRVWPTS